MYSDKPAAFSRRALKGKKVLLRPVEEVDAAFILRLRVDERYNQWLSPVGNNLEKQKQWISEYKERERRGCEYYFIIECRNIPCGTVRVYDLKADSFRWGSWILNEDKTAGAAVESFLMVQFFGFETLSRLVSRWETMKENLKAVSFFHKMGVKPSGEDEKQYFYRLEKRDYFKIRTSYKKLLNDDGSCFAR